MDLLSATRSEGVRLIAVQLVSEISNLCDHNPPTSQTDGRTDGQTDRRTTCDPKTAHMHLRALRGKNRDGDENHAYFHESWGRLINLLKHICMYFSFSEFFLFATFNGILSPN